MDPVRGKFQTIRGSGQARLLGGLLILLVLTVPAWLLVKTNRAWADYDIDKYGSNVRVDLENAESEAIDAIGESLKGYNGRPLRLDPRLVLVARQLASQIREQPAQQSRFFSSAHTGQLMSRHGVYETSQNTRLFFYQTTGDIQSQVSFHLAGQKARFTEMGAGALDPDGSGRPGILVIVLTEKRAELSPFPRKVVFPSSVSLRGQLVNECKGLEPTLLFTPPSGKVERLKLSVSGNSFSSTVVFDQGPGTYRVEVMAAGGGKSLVAALMEVTAGYGTGGEAPLAEAPAASKYYGAEDEAEKAMLELINQLRENQGLGPLMIDDRLQQMAKEHSRDMKTNNFVGHLSPTLGTVEDRAKAAGLYGIAVFENVALCDSVEQGMNNLLKSPAHRTPFFDPDLNYVGIGIVFDDSNGARHYYITQEFASM